MASPNALILTGYGINCDNETQHAFEKAGGRARRVHINDLIEGIVSLSDYQILAFPGGFSYGDDIAAGRVLANKFISNLRDDLLRFIGDDKLVIGICNGFQVMVKLGLLTSDDSYLERQTLTLTYNDSGRFEDRWVHVAEAGEKCVFTRGISQIYLPVAHGEGKFFAEDTTLDILEAKGQVALRYVAADGSAAAGRFPENPNGSPRDIAGVCDATGRIFGLMPHPERFLYVENHPRWTREAERLRRLGQEPPDAGQGLRIFQNAVSYFG
jgi:phosphoribosylformylglycinamidine synthase subunit PurQ / glutaminase